MDVVSTTEVPVGDGFAFWREVNSKLWVPYDLRCEPQWEPGFRAQVGISEFGPVQATFMSTMPHSVHRTPKLIRQADPEVFKLGCLVRGGGMITQDGRRTDFGVGDLILYDTSRPYLAEFAPDVPVSQLLLLRFPRSLLPLPPRELRRLSAVRIPGAQGIGALSSQFLLQLARHMDELSPLDAARLSTLTIDVLTAALANALDVQSAVPPPHPTASVDGSDPRLCPRESGRSAPDTGRDRHSASHLAAIPAQAVPGGRAHGRRLGPRASPGAVPTRPRQP